MAKHQIFLVHGMGAFEPGWSETVRRRFVDAFATYPRLRDGGFADKFEFKEILYDDTFEAWRQQWREDAAAAAKLLTALGADGGAVGQLIQAAGAPGQDGFAATHVLDVVAYHFLLPVSQAVCRSVQLQILGHLKSFPANDVPRYSVVAHSLGTAVVYETFHAMLTQGVDGARLTAAFRPDNVFMLANTARLLWNRGGDAYPAALAPDLADGDGLCFRFQTFRHALDPIPAVNRFNPPDRWFAPTAPREQVYADVSIPAEDIQDVNVHSFEHHLGHPAVQVPMLRALTGFSSGIQKKDIDDALEAWRTGRLLDQKRAQAKARLQALATRETAGWADEIALLLAVRQLAAGSKLRDGES